MQIRIFIYNLFGVLATCQQSIPLLLSSDTPIDSIVYNLPCLTSPRIEGELSSYFSTDDNSLVTTSPLHGLVCRTTTPTITVCKREVVIFVFRAQIRPITIDVYTSTVGEKGEVLVENLPKLSCARPTMKSKIDLIVENQDNGVILRRATDKISSGDYAVRLKGEDSNTITVLLHVSSTVPPAISLTKSSYTTRIQPNQLAYSPLLTIETNSTVYPTVTVIRFSLARVGDGELWLVDEMRGEVMNRHSVIPEGVHQIYVNVEDERGKAQRRQVLCTIIVEKLRIKSQRSRRQLRPTLQLTLPENTKPVVLDARVPLMPSERILDAPVVTPHLTVHSNGSVELTKSPNYEEDKSIKMTVIVANTNDQSTWPQSIELKVLDVAEPPAFVNIPHPYRAIVPLEPPKHFTVYRFNARREMGDAPSGQVDYQMMDVDPPGSFEVTRQGAVRTLLPTYTSGSTYKVSVQAVSTIDGSQSTVAVLDVRGGHRAPQFAKAEYYATLNEDTPVHASVAHVMATSFERPVGHVRLSLTSDDGTDEPHAHFAIHPRTGVVQLRRAVDADSGAERDEYRMQVIAREPDIGESHVSLTVRVLDVNDNPPVFAQPLYTATVPENVALGVPLIHLDVTDADKGANARLRYTVDDIHFDVTNAGELVARLALDADQHAKGYHIYMLTVTATDSADVVEERKSATTKVHIRTENVNDERPHFIPTSQYVGYIAEDAQGNTPIVTIQAEDRDRDQVLYAFVLDDGTHGNELDGLFGIDRDTGLIRLLPSVVAADDLTSDYYNVTVVATDDGQCCGGGGTRHSSYATLVISVTDVNNHKPVFPDCSKYGDRAVISEGRHTNGTVVIQVLATDLDSHRNGQLQYSLYYPQGEARKAFVIDANTGVITASPYVEFDREDIPFEDITVKATDKGDRPLIGFCQFTVRVSDVNDGAPQFERQSYETAVYRKSAIGTSVVSVFADDSDAPHNARVTYSLQDDPTAGEKHKGDREFFTIGMDSGEVTATNSLPSNRKSLRFLVEASDNGSPTAMTERVAVTVNVRNAQQSAPKWAESRNCQDVLTINETTSLNTPLFSCYAVAHNKMDSISYSMANGAKVGTNGDYDFREFPERRGSYDWVVVRNLKQLDYEKTTSYNLTLTATDMRTGVSSDRLLRVVLLDRNDEVPKFKLDKFTGQVIEEKMPSATHPVAKVDAIDADMPGSPASTVTYSILPGPASALFRIRPDTGEIFAMQMFDREKNDSFILDVQARDGEISALPQFNGHVGAHNKVNTKVQIHVQDVNDNAPYFERDWREARVPENAQVGQNVLTVKAHDADRDSTLRYRLVTDRLRSSSERAVFGVRANSGTVFVSEPLDYEKRRSYTLTLRVTDGKHTADTQLHINVTDVNDNAPVFTQSLYEVTIAEESKSRMPQQLLKVAASDADGTPGSIVYRLEGQGVPDFFVIDNTTGVIDVVAPLDRDQPRGAPVWKFIVQAVDESGKGLVGYADVQVTLTDINDNPPRFDQRDRFGYVDENREPGSNGVFVMRVAAVDYDDPATPNAIVRYMITVNKRIENQPVFRIDSDSGNIYAMRSLDRENPSENRFDITVSATDSGQPALQASIPITIRIRDINDNAPHFTSREYSGSVLETAPVDTPVLTITAMDRDDEAADNVLQYEISTPGDRGADFFYMTTDSDTQGNNVGVIRVKKTATVMHSPKSFPFPLTDWQLIPNGIEQ